MWMLRGVIVYNFGPDSKHGIYRYIPVVFQNSVGTLKTRVSNVSVTDQNGAPYTFTTSTSGNNYNIKIGDANVLVSGVKTYVINYTIAGVVAFLATMTNCTGMLRATAGRCRDFKCRGPGHCSRPG